MFINFKEFKEFKNRSMNDILIDIKSKLNDKALDFFENAKSSWADDVNKQLDNGYTFFEVRSQYTKSGRPELIDLQE